MIRKAESQIRYLSQAIQLEEAVNPSIIRNTMMIISLTVVAFCVWAGFTNINEVARTPGEIVPDGYQQVVQHLEGGMIEKINVSEGMIVKKGQVLLELDGAGTDEDLKRSRHKETALLMQEERLRAYLENREPDFSRFENTASSSLQDQHNFFASMEQVNEEERKVIAQQVEQKNGMIRALQTELATAQENLKISSQLFEKKSELYGKGFLSETKYLEAQQAINSIRGDITQVQSRISVARAEISEYQKRLSSLGFSQNDKINERLDAILVERAQHEEMTRKLEERTKRLIVRAPVDGIVKGLSVNTIGAVVKPGETLMEIVPVSNEMIVQVKIPPQHIGHLKSGQKVKVKLSSFDFSRYGLLDGTLEQISATTFNGANGERYYQGRIVLDRNYIGHDKSHVVLPGMTVMAEIITGRKTILEYLLKPIHNSLITAFSER